MFYICFLIEMQNKLNLVGKAVWKAQQTTIVSTVDKIDFDFVQMLFQKLDNEKWWLTFTFMEGKHQLQQKERYFL